MKTEKRSIELSLIFLRMARVFFLMSFLLVSFHLRSQAPTSADLEASKAFYIKSNSSSLKWMKHQKLDSLGNGTFKIYGSWNKLKSFFEDERILFVQPADRIPKEEAKIRQHDFSVNSVFYTQSKYPNINGKSISVDVKENAFDTSDVDINSRATLNESSSPVIRPHATEMATIIGGSGISSVNGQGVVNKVHLYSSNFARLVPEPTSYYETNGITVQNHSYGVGIENYYGVESAAYDQQSFDLPHLVHVFSAGNSGLEKGNGLYEGISGYANITGSFKQAKNVLVVSATDSADHVPPVNSKGPAYDGRVKPDLVAFGGDGTSDAAALISGSVAMLQEHYKNLFDSLPSSHSIRSLLIAGTDDIETIGPDFVSGFGQLNLFKSMIMVDSSWFMVNKLLAGDKKNYRLSIPESVSRIKVVLVWNDLPAMEGSTTSLVNDLDLTVYMSDNTKILPWVLNSSPDSASLRLAATRGIDRINNVEMITIDKPEKYIDINVFGYDVEGFQEYTLAYHIEYENSFSLTHPTKISPLQGGERNEIRWTTSLDRGMFEIRIGDGDWQTIANDHNLETGILSYTPPDTNAIAQIRLVSADSIFYPESFAISKKSKLRVALNCSDKYVFTWNYDPTVNYVLNNYTAGNLVEITQTMDSVTIVNPYSVLSKNFSLQPFLGDVKLTQSDLINLDNQAVGCYIDGFLAFANKKEVQVNIYLNSLDSIRKVSLTRSTYLSDEIILETDQAKNEITFFDQDPIDGTNKYLLTVITGVDTIEMEQSVLVSKEEYIQYPNPLANGKFKILSPESETVLRLNVLDMNGVVVRREDLDRRIQEFDISELEVGSYILVIEKEGSIVKTIRIVTQ